VHSAAESAASKQQNRSYGLPWAAALHMFPPFLLPCYTLLCLLCSLDDRNDEHPLAPAQCLPARLPLRDAAADQVRAWEAAWVGLGFRGRYWHAT